MRDYPTHEPASEHSPRERVLLGLVGAGIQASLTPAMHEREFAVQGVHCFYQLIDLDELVLPTGALQAILTSAELMGFNGLNVTYPCKQLVVPLLDELSSEAEALGAVNTIVLKGGRRKGFNTDARGFVDAFRCKLADVRRAAVLQLGAGGAGAAVAHALLSEGVGRLLLYDVANDCAVKLARRLQPHFPRAEIVVTTEPRDVVLDVDGLVNTTPVGMAKFPGTPIRPDLLRPRLWVADIIYFPAETELLRAARALGCRAMNGGMMAVFQAAEAFHAFSGLTANADRMSRHFEQLCQDSA